MDEQACRMGSVDPETTRGRQESSSRFQQHVSSGIPKDEWSRPFTAFVSPTIDSAIGQLLSDLGI
jgi:hypothetical protein